METAKAPTERHFEAARRKAFWNGIRQFLSGRSNKLLSWRDVEAELHPSDFVDQKVASVPLDRIVGSVGRYREFDRAFMPKLDSTAPRWRSIASAYLDRVRLPPITVYKVGNAYFVVDGHHRVSVAKELGRTSVDAHVIEAETRVPVSTDLDGDGLQIAGEHMRFLECTQLDVLRPQQSVRFTTVGAFDWALQHIALHREAMSRVAQRVVTQDEAVLDWFDRVYLPLVRIVRETGLLDQFPARTEADMFLWIVDHQRDLSVQCGPGVGREAAAEHLAYRHSVQPLSRVVRAVREWVAGPACELLAYEEAAPSSATDAEGDLSSVEGSR
jgi:uncharacterized ParB-like nuclease family protein